MTPQADLLCLPEGLRSRPQWCIAGPDKSPYVAGQGGLVRAKVNQGPWMNFEDACSLARQYSVTVGFILTAEDPFTCIDLDIKDASSVDKDGNRYPTEKWITSTELTRYEGIVKGFASYTELSSSGRGAHVWVHGNIGPGARRGGIEIYSQERFIICTGWAVQSLAYTLDNSVVTVRCERGVLPVRDGGGSLEAMVAGMRVQTGHKTELEEVEEYYTDLEIVERAMYAVNGDKFNALCRGEWQQMGYPSQSEADLALMSMFTFYSESNEQCRRLFRITGLGKRDKAQKDNRYLDNTLRIIRGRQEREQAVEINREALARQLVQELQTNHIAEQTQAVKQVQAALPDVEGLAWPPGMAGALAGFIYGSAPRPVKEVAIVAALGLLAGITGKTFVLPQSGLNVYIILVARSAVGKEAMHSGIGLILDKLRNSIPGAQNFVDFSDFASGPALVKACASNPSFCNIAGEWGRKLRRLSLEDGRDGPMQQLRTQMTNLYQKSGPTSVVGGIAYSNKDQNIASVNGVAYSMIGETTPGTFYESLTESMMEDGFLSRFTIVEYNGSRPAANKNPNLVMDKRLEEALCGLVVQSLTQISKFNTIALQFDPQARQILDNFDQECDRQINSTNDESWRQMWNRAHLKTCRIAGILAAADNYISPVVTSAHVQWALELVRRDISIMSRKLQDGDIGKGDGPRERKLMAIIRQYVIEGPSKGYRIPEEMHRSGIIPRKYLQIRTSKLSQFSGHRLGSTNALKQSLESLVDSGYIMEVDKDKLHEKYGAQGRCYRVLNLPDLPDMQVE